MLPVFRIPRWQLSPNLICESLGIETCIRTFYLYSNLQEFSSYLPHLMGI